MGWIKGIEVTLYNYIEDGTVDDFNRPIKTEAKTTVNNVLVTPLSTADIIDTLNLTGKTAVYQLCIPKGDTNNWTNAVVEFMGEKWRTIGVPKEYLEYMLPLEWNKQITVERYE